MNVRMRKAGPVALASLVWGVTGAALAASLTGGGVSLTIDQAGIVQTLRVAETDVPAHPLPLLSLCDVTRGTEFVPGTVADGAIPGTLNVRFEGLAADALLTVEQRAESLHFRCELTGAAGLPARGVLLRVTFPADCRGWQWHDDMQTARTIEAGESYENVQALRAWPDLPEWANEPSLRIGAANRNFCTVLTGPAGLCLAPDITRPVIFRTAYHGAARRLDLVYDLALSPDTDPPNRWTFAFDLYACDPKWGFRAALQAYYAMYPHLFDNHVTEPGQWIAFTDLKVIDNPNEFHFGLQEGARDPAYDDRIGVLDCTYFTHAGQFVRIPNHDPEKDPEPAFEVILAETEKTFTRRTGLDGVYAEVGLHDAAGRFQIPKTRVYGHYIAQFNLDPDLRYGKWHLDRTAEQIAEFAAKGGVLDGFYYDGLTTGLNYRVDHFRHAAAPPLWDPAAVKPALNNFFSSCEFARAAAERLRPQGKISMMNGAMHATFYVAPWLDVFGSETGLRISRSGFNFIRTIIYQKPMLTLLKGNYAQKLGHAEIELFMKRALAYGVFPGFFDWPPSGLGPGSRYWDHPAYYERDRDLHRKYLPLVKTLAAAGWEPVTHARSSNPKVFVERYGPDADGILWLTLLNETTVPQSTVLTVDAGALGLDASGRGCVDVIAGGQVTVKLADGRLTGDVTVPVDGVMMLQVATPEQAVAWRLAQAAAAVERGITMRRVDAGYRSGAHPVHWRPGQGVSSRAGQPGLVLGGRDGAGASAAQWAMLFQPETAPVRLRVRATAEGLAGKAAVRCRLAWVTSSFSHYQWHSLPLAEGTYQDREFELEIVPEHPLRAIWVQPYLPAGTQGTLTLVSVRLSDRFADAYVVDPVFAEWYEPVPMAMQPRLAADSRALADTLERARELARAGVREHSAKDAIFQAGTLARTLREWIIAENAENGCRRALRDLETAEQHLAVALMTSLGMAVPHMAGPTRAAPGDEVALQLIAPAPSGLDVRRSISGPKDVALRMLQSGARVTVPAAAEPGTVLAFTGTVSIGGGPGRTEVRTAHGITVAPALVLELQTAGAESDTGAFRLRARVRNNRTRPVRATLTLTVPAGWNPPAAQILNIPAADTETALMVLTAAADATVGSVAVVADVRAGTDSAQATKRLLYIPPSANLLRNPGFEDGPWPGGEHDTLIRYGGSASLRLHNATADSSSHSHQTLKLDQVRPCPVLVRCASRAAGVSGARNKGYSLYVDVYYQDGTTLYGQFFPFATGTTDWQLGMLAIEPEKPIERLAVHLLLREKAGTAWFDDVAVVEDPRRRGNIGREAVVTVDSCFSLYSAVPINDGIVHVPEHAHWTEESWASADAEGVHFIDMRFPRVHKLGRVVVHWSRDGGSPKTARELRIQAPENDGWATIFSVRPARSEAETVIELAPPVVTDRLRLLQPSGRGPEERAYIMWVREVEVFPVD